MTFIEYLHKQIKERSDAIAVKSEEASLTYDELDKYSNLVRESIPSEYYGAAEPPVRCGESHLSGLTEPLRSL